MEQQTSENYRAQNKKAWEYSAYDFWMTHSGPPAERAKEAVANPLRMLKQFAAYFDRYEGVRVANLCGSCGKKASLWNSVIGCGFVLERFHEHPA